MLTEGCSQAVRRLGWELSWHGSDRRKLFVEGRAKSEVDDQSALRDAGMY